MGYLFLLMFIDPLNDDNVAYILVISKYEIVMIIK